MNCRSIVVLAIVLLSACATNLPSASRPYAFPANAKAGATLEMDFRIFRQLETVELNYLPFPACEADGRTRIPPSQLAYVSHSRSVGKRVRLPADRLVHLHYRHMPTLNSECNIVFAVAFEPDGVYVVNGESPGSKGFLEPGKCFVSIIERKTGKAVPILQTTRDRLGDDGCARTRQ